MIDRAALSGEVYRIVGHDTAAQHARRLLIELGADVGADVRSATGVIDLTGLDSEYQVPVVRDEPCTSVADWARCGAMLLTRRVDGTPAIGPVGAASALRGAMLVLNLLTRLRTGISTDLPSATLLGERAAITGRRRRPPWSVGGAGRPMAAADGWWYLSMPRTTDLDLVAALVKESAGGDPWMVIDRWARQRPARDAVMRAQLLGLAAAVIPEPGAADPLDEQAAHRRSQAVIAGAGGRRRNRPDPPRVVDLSSLWAGPLCASLLAMTGAEVIKVESVRRLDGARSGPTKFYDLLHAGHRSVTLDLNSRADVGVLRELVAGADVVIESARPRALAQVGLDAVATVEAGTTWTSITAYGRTGPWSHRVGFGDDVAAGAGLVTLIDGFPTPMGDAIADPLAGVHAAAATAAALLSDRAYLLDISMREVARAAADLKGESASVVRSARAGWEVRWPAGVCPVAQPTARPSAGRGAAPGADNDAVLGSAFGS